MYYPGIELALFWPTWQTIIGLTGYVVLFIPVLFGLALALPVGSKLIPNQQSMCSPFQFSKCSSCWVWNFVRIHFARGKMGYVCLSYSNRIRTGIVCVCVCLFVCLFVCLHAYARLCVFEHCVVNTWSLFLWNLGFGFCSYQSWWMHEYACAATAMAY